MARKYLSVLAMLIATLPIGTKVVAFEIDYTSGRYKPLADSTDILDDEVNWRFKKVLKEVNADKVGCQAGLFRQYLAKAVAPQKDIGLLERWAEGGIFWPDKISNITPYAPKYPGVPRHQSDPKTSIFKNAKGSYVFQGAGLGSNIKLNGQLVGTDKLGHFFDQGLTYFQMKVKNKLSDVEILEHGRQKEKLDHGKTTNGILSNADLAANYSGFQFWQEVTDAQDVKEPYFTCKNGKWNQVRQFTWASYVNPSWDEGINCNEYVPDLEETVKENIQELTNKPENLKAKIKFECPITAEACLEAVSLKLSFYYLHKKCYTLGWELRKTRQPPDPKTRSGQSK